MLSEAIVMLKIYLQRVPQSAENDEWEIELHFQFQYGHSTQMPVISL